MKSLKSICRAVATAVVISAVTSQAWSETSPSSNPGSEFNSESGVELEPIPLTELQTFVQAFGSIKRAYVEKISDQDLLENAIRGMLAGLDPHSAFLDADAYRDLQEGTTGEFGGLGIEVGMEDGFVRVIAPIDDTPAQRAGVKAGDLILRLNDTPVKGLSLNEAVKEMRGKTGTDIVLTIARDGEEGPIRITVTRDVIRVKSVRTKFLEPGIGYVRVSHFQTHTGEDLQTAIAKLQGQQTIRGAVLDLRNNPGGILGSAVSVTDTFLTDGLIVYTEGRGKDSELKFEAKSSDLLDNAPLVVLVNEGSASASEIVAGALQDHKRAIIMGSRTFGKGSVQTILPVNNDTALKLTTARYYTPSGRSIQAEGIVPDIMVDKVKISPVETNNNFIKEEDLSRHLTNESSATPSKSTKQESTERSLAERDYALHEALTLLKGLVLLQARAD
jgi:carboxyl-terminal processing protease